MPSQYISKSVLKELDRLSLGACEYCKCLQEYYPGSLATEHIFPAALGGTNELNNLPRSCDACNGSKYTATTAHDPATDQIVPLFHPRQDKWQDHFKWSDDLLYMEGITPTGRATIIRLKTNRAALVNLRKVLIGRGHPPV